ncbi:hypothetical protein [Couchioplanes caeruleus]|uniref:Uncharacterized protein n=2 Tax=Couchioplanes caeruleus TaxID=56438 RepID=A0A1K0FRU7_9ACTN|nr:hypothetical protein [Couchioplanes caeruleus]OJF15513.1 hypothetical protein BG844_04005 [Couchioplanes caeruleus subsp. caeruleus]ROP30949.1 hypothetical protein EDD30_3834 [Couchioplanes caeruleus]
MTTATGPGLVKDKPVKKRYAVRYLIVNAAGDLLWNGNADITSDPMPLDGDLAEVALCHAVTANTLRADCDRRGIGTPGRVLITAMWEVAG